MATLIKNDGSQRQLKVGEYSTLQQKQALVGGYIEFAYCEDCVLIVNEEGMFKGLDVNEEATSLYGNVIVGDVIKLSITEFNALN